MKAFEAATVLVVMLAMGTAIQAAPNNKELQKLIKKAEKGDVRSQYELGINYERGFHSEPSLTQAIAWYEKAANGNSGYAAQSLCRIFTDGKILPSDYDRALPFCLQADRLISDAPSSYYATGYESKLPTHIALGHAYCDGDGGLAKDPVKARHHLEQAAFGGDSHSVDRLVKVYSELPDGDRNDAEILKNVHIIRKAGANAIVGYMAIIYEKGRAVEPDALEAERLYRIAADKGDAAARAWLAARPDLTVEKFKLRLVNLASEPYRSFFVLHHSPASTEPPLKLNVASYLFRDLANFYPTKAMDYELGGNVELNCKWSDEGALTNCIVVSESTPGYGFSEATIKMMERPLPVYDIAEWKKQTKGKHLHIKNTWTLR